MSRWKLSAGTASVVGVKRTVCLTPPTTAYVMLGEKCRNNCQFCAQAAGSQAGAELLSRVTWPEFEEAAAVNGIAAAGAQGAVKRVCLQVINSADSWRETLAALAALKAAEGLPVCVSGNVTSADEATLLIDAGADRVSLALDAATPAVFAAAKGGDWQRRWELLHQCAARLPDRVSTHLIVGLGETEEEMAATLGLCIKAGITVGLFAFTPVRGTAWGHRQPPSIGQYRRIQIVHQLFRLGYGREVLTFTDGRISGIMLAGWQSLLADGTAFETSGCPDCNRPYYNERPGGILYNYPRRLTAAETDRALAESGLAEGGVTGEVAVY